eukprot:2493344-Prymnesium_polylepis.1
MTRGTLAFSSVAAAAVDVDAAAVEGDTLPSEAMAALEVEAALPLCEAALDGDMLPIAHAASDAMRSARIAPERIIFFVDDQATSGRPTWPSTNTMCG